ncbi:MAG: hypothetical protein QM687_02605 [Ferruginibacter sp.]
MFCTIFGTRYEQHETYKDDKTEYAPAELTLSLYINDSKCLPPETGGIFFNNNRLLTDLMAGIKNNE